MKIKLQRSYRSKNTGTPVFVYTVSGNAEELSSYENLQGEYYREDTKTGEPLWFTTRCVGDFGSLIITTNDKIVADMSEFDKAASVAAQYGGNLGEQLASIAAAKLLGGAPAPVEATVEASAPASTNLDDM